MKESIKWSIDPAHSEIAFKVRHLMIAHVNGSFKTFDASIYTTGKDFTSAEIDLWIDASSVTTGDEKRDEHLKGPEFSMPANTNKSHSNPVRSEKRAPMANVNCGANSL